MLAHSQSQNGIYQATTHHPSLARVAGRGDALTANKHMFDITAQIHTAVSAAGLRAVLVGTDIGLQLGLWHQTRSQGVAATPRLLQVVYPLTQLVPQSKMPVFSLNITWETNTTSLIPYTIRPNSSVTVRLLSIRNSLSWCGTSRAN